VFARAANADAVRHGVIILNRVGGD
jgi:hypothetical protein